MRSWECACVETASCAECKPFPTLIYDARSQELERIELPQTTSVQINVQLHRRVYRGPSIRK
jgi:hypothetical protein